MNIIKRSNFYWIMAVGGVFLLGVLVQAYIMLNFDVSWLLKATARLLSGGHYYTDFVETNPPLILYVYSPVVFLAKMLHLPLALIFKIYTFVIVVIMVGLCDIFLRRIFSSRTHIRYALLFTLMFAFVLMPGYSFGEREHFAIMFTLPYFLLVVSRLSRHEFSWLLLCIIGLIAGIGFAIKPYFLLPLILTEIYFIYARRSFFAWVRIETITIALFMLIYLGLIFIVTPNYIYKIWPLVYNLYFVGNKEPWVNVIAHSVIVFCLVTIGFYYWVYEKICYRYLANVLLFAAIGYVGSYFMQHTNWYYHVLPAFTLFTLLAVLLLCESIMYIQEDVQRGQTTWAGIVLLFCMQVALVMFPVMTTVRYVMAGVVSTHKMYTDPLYNYMKQHAQQQPITIFTVQIYRASSITDYAGALWGSRFPSMLFMSGIVVNSARLNKNTSAWRKFRQKEQEVNNLVLADLYKYKPKFILEDRLKINVFPLKTRFNYLKYFSRDPRFVKFWRQYKYVTTLSDFAIYERH
jgi:hypothetical protein